MLFVSKIRPVLLACGQLGSALVLVAVWGCNRAPSSIDGLHHAGYAASWKVLQGGKHAALRVSMYCLLEIHEFQLINSCVCHPRVAHMVCSEVVWV